MIIELHPGEYALSVKSPGFRSLTRQIAVKAGENQKIGFILQVQSCPPGPCIEVTRASPSAITPQVQPEPKILSITSLKLFAWQDFNKKKKYVEVQDFQETQNLRLLPSEQFDVVCEVMGETNLWAQDFFLWTTVDFLIAPVTHAYEQMDNNELGLNIGWGQLTEMRDLQVIPVYSLRREETRELVVKDLDLRPVLAAFPVRDAGNLWPWLIHVTAHFQDRSGKQVAFAERTLRLSPSSARKTSHYKDPPPGR
jgi:hypothetical protein